MTNANPADSPNSLRPSQSSGDNGKVNPTSTGVPPKMLVSLATYNESCNLEPLVEAIRAVVPWASILVIDDNSPDGTGKLADELALNHPNIHVIHRPGKLGLGTATLAAMDFAVNGGYDYLLNMDADFSHPPRFIPALVAGMSENDVMIGSRYIVGGGVEGEFGLKRQFMSQGINTYARFFLGLKTRDNSGAFRCYRVSKLALLDFQKVLSRGYSFQEEILYWCKEAGCRFGETPILFENRRAGVSKINRGEAVSALKIIFRLGVGRLFRPLGIAGSGAIKKAVTLKKADASRPTATATAVPGPHRPLPRAVLTEPRGNANAGVDEA